MGIPIFGWCRDQCVPSESVPLYAHRSSFHLSVIRVAARRSSRQTQSSKPGLPLTSAFNSRSWMTAWAAGPQCCRHRAYPDTGTLFQTPPPWVGEPPTARPGFPSSCAQGRLEPGAVLFTVDAAAHDDPLCVYPVLHSIHGKSLFPRDSCILAIGKAAGTSRPPLDESQCGAFPFAESCLRQS